MAKIDALEKQVSEISTAITGSPALGIPGIVKLLENHIDQTNRNKEEIISMFKEFKRDVVLDWVKDTNAINEDVDYVTKRVKVLEDIDKASTKKIGIFLGFGIVAGFVISNLDTIVKFFYGE